jgi:hypothetical protein
LNPRNRRLRIAAGLLAASVVCMMFVALVTWPGVNAKRVAENGRNGGPDDSAGASRLVALWMASTKPADDDAMLADADFVSLDVDDDDNSDLLIPAWMLSAVSLEGAGAADRPQAEEN